MMRSYAVMMEEKMKHLYILLTLGIGTCSWMLKRAFENNLVENSIPLLQDAAGKERTIFFISDIHRRKISYKWIKTIPPCDLVIIGGDIMEKGVPFSRVEDNLKCLQEIGPLIFVYGNNDEEIERERLSDLLHKNNVLILENSSVKWHFNDGGFIWISGLGDISYEKDDLVQALKGIPEHEKKILVSHDPSVINQLNAQLPTIDLILSGHTHGGQIRIFGFGPYQLGGVSSFNSTVHLISNGYGTTFLPFRLGAKSEANYITLTGN